jgi:hypothetical protein
MLKCVTKSKRRVTLSICGLGWLDESEVAAIPDAQPVAVDMTTGEINPEPPVVQAAQRERSRVPADGKRWSESQLAWFWANLGELDGPRVTGDDLHRILGVGSIHDFPDLDDALERVREARAPLVTTAADMPTDMPPEAEDEESLGDLMGGHPPGSIEAEWARYAAARSVAAGWNRDYPEQSLRFADPPRDATPAQVRAYAEGLERRLAKLVGTAQP